MKCLTLIIFTACMLLCKPVFSQHANPSLNGITFYLVRHAEKDTGNNPALKPAGYIRSGDLYRALKKKKITMIYVSQYRRTALTADSLRIYNKIDTVHYLADAKGDDLINKLIQRSKEDKNMLIVGHSNTIPDIIRRLGVQHFELNEIPDNEFDNLYIVTIKNNKATLKQLKFGKPSVTANDAGQLKPLQ